MHLNHCKLAFIQLAGELYLKRLEEHLAHSIELLDIEEFFESIFCVFFRYIELFHQMEPIGICNGRHKCGDGSCVSPHHICDGVWDCADRSDEISCPSGE